MSRTLHRGVFFDLDGTLAESEGLMRRVFRDFAATFGRNATDAEFDALNGPPVPIIVARLHWVACEAVLAADALHRRTGEERFAAAAARWWGEIDRYFLDRAGGGWWQELGQDMAPAASIWSGKPDLYHSYQAVLLPSLPLSPTAATALARQRLSPARPGQSS